MLKQKIVFAVSLIAMIAGGVGSARADIASTVYVQQGVKTATTAASTAQISANNANTAAGAAQTSADAAQKAADAAQVSADEAKDAAAEAQAAADNANSTIANLDLLQVGADGSYIKTVKQDNGKVTATAEVADTTPTSGSKKMVTSGGVYTALSGKQATLTTSQLNAANSGITPAKVDTYDAYASQISAKEPSVNKVSDFATASSDDKDSEIKFPTTAFTQDMIDATVASTTNQVNTLNTKLTSLQTTVTSNETDIEAKVATKVSTAQGSTNANKAVITNSSGDITTGTIVTGMIEDVAVTNAKIANGAVTAAKTSGVIGYIPSGSATSTTYATIWVE